ncbi:hypothetical protein ACFW6E_26150 [Streptomyces olivaceoviridis]|uniref:hypothetical protein n=1 Tax=Streptomyces olivaceoviridis TaxID=1921 RepID=UPI003674A06F
MLRDDMPACVRWEILTHGRFSGVWICEDPGRATTGTDPTELGRAVLAAYLADRDSRGETFRVLIRTDHGNLVVITADHLTDPGAGKRTRPSARHCPPTFATPSPDAEAVTPPAQVCSVSSASPFGQRDAFPGAQTRQRQA